MLITDIPQPDETFRRTFVTEKTETMAPTLTCRDRRILGDYTITGRDWLMGFRCDYTVLSNDEPLSSLGRQASIIAFANALFSGSKPLVGKEMEVLNKTFKRLRSSVPTKL